MMGCMGGLREFIAVDANGVPYGPDNPLPTKSGDAASSTVALDAPTLAALETTDVGNLPAAYPLPQAQVDALTPKTATDTRTLTERMFAKAPAVGYALWLDTADVTHIYLAEAPVADTGAATTFRGIRVQKDTTGNPVGKVQILDGFVWDTRTTAVWA